MRKILLFMIKKEILFVYLLIIHTLLSGCSSSHEHGNTDASQAESSSQNPLQYSFPKDFLFGTSIAGFQADMGCPTMPAGQCEDRNSDWYQYITSWWTRLSPLTYLNGDPPSAGPGHWELYPDDYALAAQELGNNAFRYSFEWSRIFPTPTDGVEGYDDLKKIANQDAITHYHTMLAAMQKAGLKPLMTVNHYTLPAWIHDGVGCHPCLLCSRRGWLDKDRIVREITKFAGFVAQEFGSEVDLWATINEPMAIVLPGYIAPTASRTNPPAAPLKLKEALQVYDALIEAHAKMYDAIKAHNKHARVGMVISFSPFFPKNPLSDSDVSAAEHLMYLYNWAILDAVILGQYDSDLMGKPVYRPDFAGHMDYLGINYYFPTTIGGTESAVFPLNILSPLLNVDIASFLGSDAMNYNYPKGIYDSLSLAKQRYGLPMIITENGSPYGAKGYPDQEDFMVRNISWVAKAMEEGAKVEGYFYWSFMDNYEWNHGLDLKFGLYAVDKNDPQKKRTPRSAALSYSRIAKNKGVPMDLAAAHPIE